jgi:hypothetical protein
MVQKGCPIQGRLEARMRLPSGSQVSPKSRTSWFSNRGSLSLRGRRWPCSAGSARECEPAEGYSNRNGFTSSQHAMAGSCVFGACMTPRPQQRRDFEQSRWLGTQLIVDRIGDFTVVCAKCNPSRLVDIVRAPGRLRRFFYTRACRIVSESF